MQDNTGHQATPGEAAKREFSRGVEAISANILAAGEPRPKWTQEGHKLRIRLRLHYRSDGNHPGRSLRQQHFTGAKR